MDIILNAYLGRHRFADGLANETYRVDMQDGPHVLKVYHPKRRTYAEKEYAVLRSLREYVPVPAVECFGDYLVPGRTALLMEYLPHPNARQIRHNLTDGFYTSAADFLGRLHRAGQSRFVRSSLVEWATRHSVGVHMQPFEYYCGLAHNWLQILKREGVTMAAPLALLLDRMRSHNKFFDKSNASFVHGDYTPQNLLTDGARVVAVIDCEKAMLGDPNYDVHYFAQLIVDRVASMIEATAFLTQYEEVHTLPAYFEERRNFYRYYRGFQRTFRYRNDVLRKRPTIESQETLHRFLLGLVEYSDPWLSSKKKGVL